VGNSHQHPYELALSVARRLAEEPAKSATASWHSIELSRTELAAVRQAFVELAFAIRIALPDGIGPEHVQDMLDELDAQRP
jgi:hypothetical protein